MQTNETLRAHRLFVYVAVALLLVAAVGAAYAYTTSLTVENNTVESNYATIQVRNGSDVDAKYLVNKLSIASGTYVPYVQGDESTVFTISQSGTQLYYADTKDLSTDLEGQPYQVDMVTLIHLSITGLTGLDGCKVSMDIGGAHAESIVLADYSVSMYTSVATVNLTDEGKLQSGFLGNVKVTIINPTSAAKTFAGGAVTVGVKASHVDDTAKPLLSAGNFALSGSDGHYSGHTTLKYDEVRSTGAYAAIITITATSENWTPTAGDVLVLTLSGDSDYVAGYKYTTTTTGDLKIYLPIPIQGGNYSGRMDVDLFTKSSVTAGTTEITLSYSLKEVGLSPASS